MHWTLSDGSKFDTSPLLTEPYYSRHPQAWSPDGGELLFMGAAPTSGTGWDILALPLTPDASPRPVVQSPFREMQAEFSPDGQWIAFTSNRDGRGEVYVQAYPDGTPRKVSPSQGTDPVWSPDGDELFYLDGNALMAVPIQTAPTLEIGAPSRLFDTDGWIMEVRGHTYDVAADGRFVVAKTDGIRLGAAREADAGHELAGRGRGPRRRPLSFPPHAHRPRHPHRQLRRLRFGVSRAATPTSLPPEVKDYALEQDSSRHTLRARDCPAPVSLSPRETTRTRDTSSWSPRVRASASFMT